MVDQLLGQELLTAFLSICFRTPPTPAFLFAAREAGTLKVLPLQARNRELEQGRQLMERGLTEGAQHLAAEYHRLLVGPGPLPAPPWESVYRTPDGLMLGAPARQVQEWYGLYGLQPPPGEAPDHVGIELDFLAELFRLERRTGLSTRDVRTSFLDEHLKQWVPSFCADLNRAAGSEFYRGLAVMTTGLLAAL